MRESLLSAIDPAILDLLEDTLSRAAPATTAQHRFDANLWQILAETGLDRLTGASTDATWLEAVAALRIAAGHAADVPLAENDLMAGWLADIAGLPHIDGIRTLTLLDQHGRDPRVPWAGDAQALVFVGCTAGEYWVGQAPAASAHPEPGYNLAGHPRHAVEIQADLGDVRPLSSDLYRSLLLRAKLARLAQCTGAMRGAVELSITHATSRRQFGRPISKFQAVQGLIADAACESRLAWIAVDAAVEEIVRGEDADLLELKVAIAASVVARASSIVVRNTHQIHGAMGTTLEHPLHLLTNAVLAWRTEYGPVSEWEQVVSRYARRIGAWRTVVLAGPAAVSEFFESTESTNGAPT